MDKVQEKKTMHIGVLLGKTALNQPNVTGRLACIAGFEVFCILRNQNFPSLSTLHPDTVITSLRQLNQFRIPNPCLFYIMYTVT